MAEKRPRQVVSKQFSCSELKDGHKELMAIKTEAESEDELLRKIKESMHTCITYYFAQRMLCNILQP